MCVRAKQVVLKTVSCSTYLEPKVINKIIATILIIVITFLIKNGCKTRPFLLLTAVKKTILLVLCDAKQLLAFGYESGKVTR